MSRDRELDVFFEEIFGLLERKDHLIKKLPKLSAGEKDQVIEFFRKKPNLENKINWNNKNLTFADFKEVMATTKTERKRKVSQQGISGLKKGEDYIPLTTPKGVMDAYVPLHWEASKLIASRKVGGCEGKWCIAQSKGADHWRYYVVTNREIPIYFIGNNVKYSAMIRNGKLYSLWDHKDQEKAKYSVDLLGFDEPSEFDNFLRKNQSRLKAAREKLNLGHWFLDGLKDGKIKVKDADYTIKDGALTWHDGTWVGGVWEDGIWEGGTWKSGAWVDGVWEDGVWEDGIWEGGSWEDGVWKNGVWEKGTWYNGWWEDGVWEDGTWYNGWWEDGVWEDGTWKSGTWEDGVWEDGIWRSGTWKDGIRKKGIWYDGTWEDGVWEDGTWEGGTWKDGTWEGGTWKDGTWKDGGWTGGVWEGGVWQKGAWYGGIWKGSEKQRPEGAKTEGRSERVERAREISEGVLTL